MNRYFTLAAVPADEQIDEAIQNTSASAYKFGEQWQLNHAHMDTEEYSWKAFADALFELFKVQNEIEAVIESLLSINMLSSCGTNLHKFNTTAFNAHLLKTDGTLMVTAAQMVVLLVKPLKW